jgi:hypothetical protein
MDQQEISRQFKEEFIKKMKLEENPYKGYTFLGRRLFNWVSPFIDVGSTESIDYDMMPNLTKEFQHSRYSKKIRHFFNAAMVEYQKSDAKSSKTFIIRLVWRCFKWDIIIAMILVLILKFLDYSTSFFIQSILQIKDNYQSDEYHSAFIKLCSSMMILKIINTITVENVNYFIVALLGFVGEQNLLLSIADCS